MKQIIRNKARSTFMRALGKISLMLLLAVFTVGFSSASTNEIIVQQKQVTGKVVGPNGDSMPGVTVVEKGTTKGTVTDDDGNYSILVSGENPTLVFSFVGMRTKEVEVGNQTTVNVELEEETIGVDEVVVVGYGTMQKKDITGAVATVKSEDIADVPVANIPMAIQGKVAGMQISTDNGGAGEGATIRIRGNRSINASNNPLIILDGIPYSGNINDININDIESIDVLKDASATAIYGSRGANGVILVTTKRGAAGKSTITLDSYYGITEQFGKIYMRDADSYINQRTELAKYDGYWDGTLGSEFSPWEIEQINKGVSTDFVSPLTRQGYRQNPQLSFNGGTDKTKYYISTAIFDEKGIVQKNTYQRLSLRVNIDQEINDWLSVGVSSITSRSARNPGIYSYTMHEAFKILPISQPFDDDGEIIAGNREVAPGQSWRNPYIFINSDMRDEEKTTHLINNIYGELKFSDALTYRLNVGLDMNFYRRGRFRDYLSNNLQAQATAAASLNQRLEYTVENILTFKKDIGIHQIHATGLYSVQNYNSEAYNLSVKDLPYESQLFYNMGTAPSVTSYGSNLTEWGINSYMARVQYSLLDKYLLTATIRADGSSRLAEGNKWAYFPSVAAGWRVSEEAFMQNIAAINNLKLRISYGKIGNTSISPYQTQGGLSQTGYLFDNSPAIGFAPGTIPNPDLGWEITTTTNIGLDFGIIDSKINGSVEFYRQNTSDLLLERQLPFTSGYSSILENVGKTKNAGIEATLSAYPVNQTNGIQWSIDATYYKNKEEIVELYSGKEDDIGNRWFIAYPINVWYDYEYDRIWQIGEESEAASYQQAPGIMKVVDQPGEDGQPDGVIDSNDRIILGTPRPDFMMSLTNNVRFKGIEVNILALGQFGGMLYNEAGATINYANDKNNSLDLDFWTPENPNAYFGAVTKKGGVKTYGSSYWYADGTFIKIKNITLAYNFNEKLLSKLPISKLRIYANAYNTLQFAKKIPGATKDKPGLTLDYEDNANVIALEEVPVPKVFIFGVNVTF